MSHVYNVIIWITGIGIYCHSTAFVQAGQFGIQCWSKFYVCQAILKIYPQSRYPQNLDLDKILILFFFFFQKWNCGPPWIPFENIKCVQKCPPPNQNIEKYMCETFDQHCTCKYMVVKRNKEWGHPSRRFYDLEGHLIEIGLTWKGMNSTQWKWLYCAEVCNLCRIMG